MDRKQASKLRQRIRETEEKRQPHVETLLHAGTLVEGAFVTMGRKCGKPNCRCAKGEKHISKYLSRSQDGKTQLTYVPAGDEVDVAHKAEQYRRLRQARAELMKLSAATAALSDELQNALSQPYPSQNSDAPRRRKPRGKRGTTV